MDCSSWVMICQRQEILIFPELHQFMPYCHSPSEILMGIISHAGGLTEKVGVCVIPLTLINIIVVICKAKRWITFFTHAVVHVWESHVILTCQLRCGWCCAALYFPSCFLFITWQYYLILYLLLLWEYVALLFIYFFNLGVWNPVEAVHSYFILLFFYLYLTHLD